MRSGCCRASAARAPCLSSTGYERPIAGVVRQRDRAALGAFGLHGAFGSHHGPHALVKRRRAGWGGCAARQDAPARCRASFLPSETPRAPQAPDDSRRRTSGRGCGDGLRRPGRRQHRSRPGYHMARRTRCRSAAPVPASHLRPHVLHLHPPAPILTVGAFRPMPRCRRVEQRGAGPAAEPLRSLPARSGCTGRRPAGTESALVAPPPLLPPACVPAFGVLEPASRIPLVAGAPPVRRALPAVRLVAEHQGMAAIGLAIARFVIHRQCPGTPGAGFRPCKVCPPGLPPVIRGARDRAVPLAPPSRRSWYRQRTDRRNGFRMNRATCRAARHAPWTPLEDSSRAAGRGAPGAGAQPDTGSPDQARAPDLPGRIRDPGGLDVHTRQAGPRRLAAAATSRDLGIRGRCRAGANAMQMASRGDSPAARQPRHPAPTPFRRLAPAGGGRPA